MTYLQHDIKNVPVRVCCRFLLGQQPVENFTYATGRIPLLSRSTTGLLVSRFSPPDLLGIACRGTKVAASSGGGAVALLSINILGQWCCDLADKVKLLIRTLTDRRGASLKGVCSVRLGTSGQINQMVGKQTGSQTTAIAHFKFHMTGESESRLTTYPTMQGRTRPWSYVKAIRAETSGAGNIHQGGPMDALKITHGPVKNIWREWRNDGH